MVSKGPLSGCGGRWERACEVSPAVPVWRSRGVLYDREWAAQLANQDMRDGPTFGSGDAVRVGGVPWGHSLPSVTCALSGAAFAVRASIYSVSSSTFVAIKPGSSRALKRS